VAAWAFMLQRSAIGRPRVKRRGDLCNLNQLRRRVGGTVWPAAYTLRPNSVFLKTPIKTKMRSSRVYCTLSTDKVVRKPCPK
jgi:hypothetical protein